MKPFLTSSLPLGGKVDKAELWTNEGQPNIIQAFFSKSRFTSTRILGFPFGEAVGFRRLKRSFQAFPLPEKKFSKLSFSGKNCQPLCAFPFPPRSPLPQHSRPFSFLVVISRLSSPGSSRPLQSPFFILPALFKNHFSSQSFRSGSLFSPEAQLLSHNFPQNAFYRATFFILNANICSFFYSITYKTCQHIAIFRKIFHFFYRLF